MVKELKGCPFVLLLLLLWFFVAVFGRGFFLRVGVGGLSDFEFVNLVYHLDGLAGVDYYNHLNPTCI